MTFLTDMQALATELIAEFGASCVLTVTTAGTFNVATGEFEGRTSTDHTVACSPPVAYTAREVDQLGLQGGDAKIIVPYTGLGLTPSIDMLGSFDGRAFVVKYINPMYAGHAPAAYELGVRW